MSDHTDNTSTASGSDIVWLTADNLSEAARGLPRRVALALRAVTMLRFGSLRITMPGGRIFAYEGPEPGPAADVTLNNWGIVRRAVTGGSLGVSESYLDGDWDSDDVTAFLEMFLLNSYDTGGEGFFRRSRIVNAFAGIRHWLNRNTRGKARKNIAAHYDLGNSFYEKWLDPSMTYSSALYEPGVNSLEAAQTAKYRALAEATDIRPEHHVLEIGCGWGGFAEYVAGTVGAKITCLTISREQFDYATERMAKAGLSDRVEIKFQDYRDERGTYDRIGSIEMFEAVGESFWPSYFSQLRDCLKPGGRAGVQVITIRNEDYAHYRANPDFIQKYIFPGGMLPTPSTMDRLAADVGMSRAANLSFGPDYARTLAEWRERFRAKWDIIAPMGFDERFKRMWEFYLHYCEAGFRVGSIDVRQMVFAKA